ncbi:anti-phage deoxyguanosine triphosphatase [Shewanella algae]|uniref:anti-phage deoxyguanosine triphosphatase n=1 Tax=Shewanella algae TaxID=38313 RepID=UPI003AB06865
MNMSIWKERRFEEQTKEHEVRSPWERDYARLVHSAAFRRLQSKTQVLGLGESDFYRTRLTHSIEVAQIGVGIVRWLKSKHAESAEIIAALPTSALMNSICFAHDIGHPPFGHGGEVALNLCMREYGGFEGNGQTLRILAKLDKYTENHGMNPTRRLLLGVLKYPVAYSSAVQDNAYGRVAEKIWLSKASEQHPPKCYLDDEQDVVSWVLNKLDAGERTSLTRLELDEKSGHLKAIYHAFDTSILELADDISYSLHDLEDAISVGMIRRKDWDEHFVSGEHRKLFTDCGLSADAISSQLFSEVSHERKSAIGQLVHKCITSTYVEESGIPQAVSPLLKWNAKMNVETEKLRKHIFKLVKAKAIKSTNVQQLEFKGQKLVVELFEALASDPERLLPASTLMRYNQADASRKMRVICDFISGMTDEYATRMYEKIYHPHKGSIFDRL